MCQLGRLHMNTGHRLAACRTSGGPLPGTALHAPIRVPSVRAACGQTTGSSHAAQQPQQQWPGLQLAHQTLFSCSSLQQQRQSSSAAFPLPPGAFDSSRSRSSSSSSGSSRPGLLCRALGRRCHSTAVLHAGARDSDIETAIESEATQTFVTTIEKQELVSLQDQQQQEQSSEPQPSSQPSSSSSSSLPQSSADIDDFYTGGSSSSNSSIEPMQPVTKPLYSPLHYDVLEFVRQVVPTPAERAEKQRVIQCVAAATKRSFEDHGGIRVQPFGSFVNGLSTWNSDVDLVVTGLVKPSRITGGFSHNDKRLVYRALERIASNLRKNKKVSLRKMIIIRTARIPIIKLETHTRVVADISLGDTSGPQAAHYVSQQINAYPPLAPLVLVLKVFLRSCGLNEVANGGLSSFSLTNMVLAHLMEELKDGHDVFDLGETLYGFLLRFGDEFDIRRDAVSVALGGVVPRSDLGHLDRGGDAASMAGERLLLEDPLTGRDVASGSYRVTAVQMAFSKAARRLEALAQSRHSSGGHINYLEGLFNVQRALDREHYGGRRGGAAWGAGAALKGGLADEYFVIDQGGRYMDVVQDTDNSVELALDGDDYGDELEGLDAYMYPQDTPRGRKRRGSR